MHPNQYILSYTMNSDCHFMNLNKLLLIFVLFCALFSCTRDQLDMSATDMDLENTISRVSPSGNLSSFTLPETGDYSQFMQDPRNPMTPEKVALGKLLFYETGLATDAIKDIGKETYSCSSCHVPDKGFMPGRVQGIADGGIGFGNSGEGRSRFHLYDEEELDVQGARPLSLLNVGFVTNTSWSGMFGAGNVNQGTEDKWKGATEVNQLGYFGLESQNIEGLHLHRMDASRENLERLGYESMYDNAFPNIPKHERYSEITTSFAISAYLRTLVPNEAPFQNWLRGDMTAMSEEEKRGAILFFSKAGCVNCHQGPGLNNQKFYALGVKDLYETGEAFATGPNDIRNLGRGGFTEKTEDMFKFKVPQIYNMKNANHYFHGSSKKSLKEVVEYFNDGLKENANVPSSQISGFFHPLNLTPEEVNDLTSFLEHGLYDPNLNRYIPDEVLSGNCFPNNDVLSRVQMGCE